MARTMATDGRLTETPITVNSTMIAPPGTIWMVENTGDVDLKVLVVIGCHQPGIYFFGGWNSTDKAETELPVMPWNQQCPPPLGKDELTVIV